MFIKNQEQNCEQVQKYNDKNQKFSNQKIMLSVRKLLFNTYFGNIVRESFQQMALKKIFKRFSCFFRVKS